MRNSFLAAVLFWAASIPVQATVFATFHGVIHDPQHHPVAGAQITLQADDSAFTLSASTGSDGEFTLPPAPIGVYRLTVAAPGFATVTEPITLASGTNPVAHIALAVTPTTQSVTVEGLADDLSAADSATPTTLITRAEIEETPGASRTIGMEMITDYVPGAYITHDMLHMRGGHQTSWLIDGIAIPNTKIASNVGPQIDPKDIDSLETQRGSYPSEVGDRTYGVFNVLPRNGFERDREGELLVAAGNFYTGETQLSLGDHSVATAWYASLNGSRSNYGLATPIAAIYHDATNSESGFLSLIRNQTPKDQLRLNAQYRQDYFDIPYDPNSNDWEEQPPLGYNSSGLRDAQTERDSFVLANWVHTFSPKALLSVAPFYHFNQADYDSLPSDTPVSTTWHQSSNYSGGQADGHLDAGPNSFSAGLYSFFQNENDLFGIVDNTTIPSTVYGPDSKIVNAGLVEFYLADHLRLGRYITLLGGERFSTYRAGLNESATYPRIGATVEIPRLHWVLRGYYGHFFQPAPILTVSTSMLNYANFLYLQSDNTVQDDFTLLPSERDEEHQFGIQIPYKGWFLDVDTVKNRVNNFLDHANLGESNIYFPIAVDGALVRAWELTLRSPELARFGQFHLTYSNQIAEQRGNIIGGFTCVPPQPGQQPDPACALGPGYISLDHDQRQTLNTGFTAKLPAQTWFSTNVYYGSGFSNALAGSGQGPYQGPYLPVHSTFDVSAGRKIGEHWKLSGSILNVTNHRVLEDTSLTVGGFHTNDPRLISAELRYRFRY
ncbi:MAG: TonB-dependent receptor [Terracidiphilus sp.]